ncbi:inorganic pyrophosphatase [Acyrthosiphon pisum]|uniref:Inorganic pyrophosphatase n=1 Tax=Acyrthosiphon pisum TaxID=7029 RepID=A0A8R2FBB2_ACYPI|nr:inorganic pyrophosphatase [Acyrthosiphon pisum]|eukprot:XP_008187333.1 PREDICTED: inorganic pyrophosphatase [Acyrthosiphon pisum]
MIFGIVVQTVIRQSVFRQHSGFRRISPLCISTAIRRTANKEYSKITYQIEERGSPNTIDYKLYIKNEKGIVSPFHDIPLLADNTGKVFNMVVEIPRWSNAKMEINTKSALNPIIQDTKKGKLRFVPNVFPHKGYIWNYGALPQTWENPELLDEHTGCKGDNDPLDVLEIGYKVAKRGEVLKVKVLGIFALIDEGETDWKVLVINVEDPIAPEVNDIKDIEKHFPGLLKATVEWMKVYRIPDGKPENKIPFNGEPKDAEFALKIVSDTHEYWKALLQKENTNGLSCVNTILNNASTIDDEKVQAILSESLPLSEPSPLLPEVDKWHFVKL